MSAPSSTSRRRTFWPSGPVWCVTSCMPRIFAGERRAPRRATCATLTPPPLPRPPAWICAFTTQTLPPSVFGGLHRLVDREARRCRAASARRTCGRFPWPGTRGSSWSVEGGVRDDGSSSRAWSGLPGQPDRMVAASARDTTSGSSARRRGRRCQRMAAVELEGLLSGSSRSSCLRCPAMVWKAAVASAPTSSVMWVQPRTRRGGPCMRWWKPGRIARPTSYLVVRDDAVAVAGVGHRVHGGFGIDDGERAIDGDAQPHVVDRAGPPDAGPRRGA